jgi:hypothetical protein
MRPHETTSRFTRALLIGCLLLTAAPVAAGAGKEALAGTPEWKHLAHLWQTLLDHSSGQVSNPTIFQGLAKDMNAVDAELAALAARGALRKPVSDYLARVFHMRYQYLSEYHYTARSSVRESPFEASRQAAHWVVELQLSVLRRPALSKADLELAQAAESNLAYQLSYLYHLDKFTSEVEQRRIDMKKREDAGEKIDWQAFDRDVERRQNLLLDAYKARKLPRVGVVNEAGPHIVALTRFAESPAAASPGP